MVEFGRYYELIYIVPQTIIDKLYSSDSILLSNSFLVCYIKGAYLIEENISLFSFLTYEISLSKYILPYNWGKYKVCH